MSKLAFMIASTVVFAAGIAATNVNTSNAQMPEGMTVKDEARAEYIGMIKKGLQPKLVPPSSGVRAKSVEKFSVTDGERICTKYTAPGGSNYICKPN